MGREVPPWRGPCKRRCRSSNLRLKRALPRASFWGNCSKPEPRTVQLVGSTGRGKEQEERSPHLVEQWVGGVGDEGLRRVEELARGDWEGGEDAAARGLR
jgi:hypothetical protein